MKGVIMAMKEIQQISESELELMKIIWRNDGAALYADIMEELEQQGFKWKKNTVLTFLSRLVDKKMISTNKIGRRNEYTALVTENEYQSEQTKKFVEKVYNGSVKGLVNMLLESNLVPENETEELRKYWKGGDSDE
jgi:predicted transcriptional regulator